MNVVDVILVVLLYVVVVGGACWALHAMHRRDERALERVLARQQRPADPTPLNLCVVGLATLTDAGAPRTLRLFDFGWCDGPALVVESRGPRSGHRWIDDRLTGPLYFLPSEKDALIRDLRRAGAWEVHLSGRR